MTFDPTAHLVDLNEGRGKPRLYLEAKWRLAWFREENPQGHIETKLEKIDDTIAVVSAKVVTDGGAIGSGIGMCALNQAQRFSGRYVEKAETAALSRALATVGYGTQYTGIEYEDSEDLSDSPVEAPRAQQPAVSSGPRYMDAKFKSKCGECGNTIAEGERIAYFGATKTALCMDCAPEDEP